MNESTLPFEAVLDTPVPEELVGDVVGKLHYVSEDVVGFELHSSGRDRVAFALRSGREAEATAVASRMAEVARKICTGYRGGAAKVLVSRPVRPGAYGDDPHDELERRGEIVRFGPGRMGLGPTLVRLVAALERRLRRVARRFDAVPWRFPSLVGGDTLDRCSYLKSFPHSLSLVAHLREDLDAIQRFADSAKWTSDHVTLDASTLDGVECLLSPTVCFHCYESLRGARLVAPTSVTALGKCFRYESGGMTGLERLWDFSMREVVFVGPQRYVLESREAAIEETVAALDAIGLAYEIRTATDPFFVDAFSKQAAFQAAFELKYEIRATLPYKASSVAVGSFNYHQDFFGRCFEIEDSDGAPAHTGCVGYGLERLALAVTAQYGPDPAGWPAGLGDEGDDW